MPLTLPPLSRRHFLAASAVALAASRLGAAERSADPNRFVLMADTHIPSSPDVQGQGIRMHDHFVQASREILELAKTPAAAMILGDCAYLHGKDEDYALLVKLLEPLRAAGLPIHLALGNHDHRERFWNALSSIVGQNKLLDSRHLMVVESPRANWILLDSLDETNKTPGVLGKEQLAWLAKTLDERKDKPALIALHHNPDWREKTGGLTDTQPLFDVVAPRKHVKAIFFGHTHDWRNWEKDGIHLVNLPPVAYVFQKEKPSGFLEAELRDDGVLLSLHALAKTHPQNGQQLELKWR